MYATLAAVVAVRGRQPPLLEQEEEEASESNCRCVAYASDTVRAAVVIRSTQHPPMLLQGVCSLRNGYKENMFYDEITL